MYTFERRKQLLKAVPKVFDYKSVLYIGARYNRFEMLHFFISNDYLIDIVEPFELNCQYLRKSKYINKVYKSTIQDFKPERKYDVVFWWHGPEHIEQTEAEEVFKKIEGMASKYVIMACPLGYYEQGTLYGNGYERHQSHWKPEMFKEFGYKTSTLGNIGQGINNLIAWKEI